MSSTVDHAVVIGGSVAGLLAARALSGAADRVTVLDRDTLPEDVRGRRGVPQDRQVHALLSRGAASLEAQLPGFIAQMREVGVPEGDTQAEFAWYLDGRRMSPARAGLIGHGVTRPQIEALVRSRVRALPNVTFLGAATADSLVVADGRVTGVRVRVGGEVTTMDAELVVDASGRGSQAGRWLTDLGFPAPTETTVEADVVYVSRRYSAPPGLLAGRNGAAYVLYPGFPRGGAVIRQEGDRFAVMLAAMLGEEPPTSDAGMAEFAAALPGPEIAQVLAAAEPLDEPAKMRFPRSTRRHFDKLRRHLGGFLVIGDALCTFNPTYGQGMTVAALEAELLARLVASGRTDTLPRRFFSAAAKLLNDPWAMATGGDLRFPEVAGRRGPIDRALNRYLDRLRVAASVDPALGTAFLHVAMMSRRPASLLAPGVVLRTLRAPSPL